MTASPDSPDGASDDAGTDTDKQTEPTRCGTVAIVGRPNVGKSTLLNRLVGQKLSITAHKPQTTRHAILGVHTHEHVQAIYVDTPGIHKHGKRALNQVLNRTAANSLHGVDVIVWVIQALAWNEHDERARSFIDCLLYTSPSPRDRTRSRMPSSA